MEGESAEREREKKGGKKTAQGNVSSPAGKGRWVAGVVWKEQGKHYPTAPFALPTTMTKKRNAEIGWRE